MEGNWFDSDVMPVPEIPVPYVCAVEREKQKAYYRIPPDQRGAKNFTEAWLLVLSQREANEIQQQAANLHRESGFGGADVSAIHARQFQLLRDRMTKLDGYPDSGGKRRTITDPAEKMAVFEGIAPEVFAEWLGAIQSWSAAREGILGNADFARSGDLPTKESGGDSETATAARNAA